MNVSMKSAALLFAAQRIQALAQAGLTYSTNHYDSERYEELRRLSVDLLQQLTDEPLEKIIKVFASESGYQTPKVDIRSVVFNASKQMLLVEEKIDQGKWTVPGGWADVGYSPFEIAEKETREETGLNVQAVRLLALFDKRKHHHPPQPEYVYKAFILCQTTGGTLLNDTAETTGARWFTREEVRHADLSTDRVTLSQLETMFEFADHPAMPALCD